MDAAAESPNRRIVWAGAVAAGAHLLLFLLIGVKAVESVKSGSTPELRLYIESQSRAGDDELAWAAEPPAASAPAAEKSGSTDEPARLPRPPSQPLIAGSSQPPKAPLPTISALGPWNGPAEGASPSPLVAVLTTAGASESVAPASGAPTSITSPSATPAPLTSASVTPTSAAPASIEVQPAQQSILTRWVTQAAAKLDGLNQQRARLSFQSEGREYVASFERLTTAESMGLERISAEIETQENGRRLHTTIELKRLAFSHFAQLVDRWDRWVQFHDDEIIGRFHSNSQIYIGYDRKAAPRFDRLVTTGASGFALADTDGYRPKEEIFRGGLWTDTERIAMPPVSAPPPSGPAGTGQTQVFSQDTRITFYPDGSYGWREPDGHGAEHRQIMSTPAYIVGARNTTLAVRGTVMGKVLVYSPERILIEGNLTYAHNPRSTLDADDYLGLMSGNDVVIATPRTTGRGDLEIDAAIYAQHRFTVTDVDFPRSGTLLIYGSLTAGSLSPTEPRYATRYEFDKRFEERRPPGFPMTDRYEIESWDAQWQAVDSEPARELAETEQPPPG